MTTGKTSRIPISAMAGGCGAPIPHHLRHALESLLRCDLSAVQLHVDPRLPWIGAQAFDNAVTTPGQCRPAQRAPSGFIVAS